VADDADPPRRHYGLKAREFERVNAPATGEARTPTAKELAILAGPSVGSGTKTSGGANREADPNDVYRVLKENRAVEQSAGRDEMEIRRIRSRRRRDYLLLLAGGNLLIVGLVALLGLNVMTVLFGFGGVLIFSLGLTWIMWQVMGRY
jgi:hypothetical protein